MDRPKKALIFGDEESASGGGDSTLRTFDDDGAVWKGHWKLTDRRSKAVENTNKDMTARHKKRLKQWLWYHVRNIKYMYCISQIIKYRRQSM